MYTVGQKWLRAAGFGRKLLSLWLTCIFLSAFACAQVNAGSIKGTVSDPSGARVAHARVTLENPLSGCKTQTSTGEQGEFLFDQVPYGSYILRITASNFQAFTGEAGVHSSVPLQFSATLELTGPRESLTVKSEPDVIEQETPRTETLVGEQTIRAWPSAGAQNRLQAIVATTPGWIAEDNGLIHIRGVDDGALYVIDGVPTPDRMDGLFAGPFDTETISSMNVITGNIPAEFGDRSGAVVIVQPKTGLDTAPSGTLSAGAGSFRTGDLSTTLAAGTRRFGFFFAGSGNRSSRFLDPVDPRNLNNDGGGVALALRGDWHATESDTLRLAGSASGANFDVPNNLIQELAGQRQRQELRDDHQSLYWQHTWSPATLTNLAYFRNFYRSQLIGSALDVPLFATQNRHHVRQGILGNATQILHGHTLKAGAEFSRISMTEFFAFAITDPQLAAEADISDAAMGFTPANPFNFASHADRNVGSAYFQDDFSLLNKFTISAGLRYDRSSLLVTDQQLSPRIGAIYRLARTRTALRVSFNRLYMPPQVENLLLASSLQARQLSPFATSGGATIFPERLSAWETGFTQELPFRMRLDAGYWWHRFRNIDDPNLLFSTTIIFPNSVARARASGVDVRLDVPERKGWSGYLSYSNSRIVEIGPLSGGLFLTSDFIQIGPGTEFTPDHDQRNSGAFMIMYAPQHHGLWTSLSGRYESGVPIEVSDADLPRIDSLPGSNLINISSGRVKPWTVLGFSAGADVISEKHVTVAAQLDIQNLVNQAFAYNFGNPFSGTHFGYPRLFAGRLKFTFH